MGNNNRFKVGDSVWVQPDEHSENLVEDNGVITEVYQLGYVVFQEDEPEDSGGSGWFASDGEVTQL